MSDAAIASVVTGLVTVVTLITGFLTLWVKLRYGVEKAEEAATKAKLVEHKIDTNTQITERIEKQTNGPLSARLQQLEDHAARIGTLEVKVETIRTGLENVGKNIDSTRHEMRTQLQTVISNLHVLSIASSSAQHGKDSSK